MGVVWECIQFTRDKINKFNQVDVVEMRAPCDLSGRGFFLGALVCPPGGVSIFSEVWSSLNWIVFTYVQCIDFSIGSRILGKKRDATVGGLSRLRQNNKSPVLSKSGVLGCSGEVTAILDWATVFLLPSVR